MYFRDKWNNLSVKNKIFIGTTVTITVAFIIIYIFLYLFMPMVYQNYQVKTIESKSDNLIASLEEKRYSQEEISSLLDSFSYSNNLFVIIKDSNNNIIYSSSREGFMNREPKGELPFKPSKGDNKRDHNINMLNIDKEFYFKQIDANCVMYINTAINSLDETQPVIIMFFPFAVISILVIAVTISIYYSKIISKPLIDINRVADNISKLNFNEKLRVKGRDEIGQLSISLNTMSDNLNRTITELEEANGKLKLDIEREREIEKERKEFIATISHELKSPLTIISGQLEGMIYNIGKYKDREKYLKESHNVTKEMQKLVLELLEISKRDKDDFKLDKNNINMSKLVRDILRENYYFIEEKKLNLSETIAEGINYYGDEKLIRKAITNIIRNAIKYSPEEASITVELDDKNLIVKNTGVNIESKEIDNLFKAFYRIEKSRNINTGGTGLGLSIFDKHEDIEYSIDSKDDYVKFKVRFN